MCRQSCRRGRCRKRFGNHLFKQIHRDQSAWGLSYAGLLHLSAAVPLLTEAVRMTDSWSHWTTGAAFSKVIWVWIQKKNPKKKTKPQNKQPSNVRKTSEDSVLGQYPGSFIQTSVLICTSTLPLTPWSVHYNLHYRYSMRESPLKYIRIKQNKLSSRFLIAHKCMIVLSS